MDADTNADSVSGQEATDRQERVEETNRQGQEETDRQEREDITETESGERNEQELEPEKKDSGDIKDTVHTFGGDKKRRTGKGRKQRKCSRVSAKIKATMEEKVDNAAEGDHTVPMAETEAESKKWKCSTFLIVLFVILGMAVIGVVVYLLVDYFPNGVSSTEGVTGKPEGKIANTTQS